MKFFSYTEKYILNQNITRKTTRIFVRKPQPVQPLCLSGILKLCAGGPSRDRVHLSRTHTRSFCLTSTVITITNIVIVAKRSYIGLTKAFRVRFSHVNIPGSSVTVNCVVRGQGVHINLASGPEVQEPRHRTWHICNTVFTTGLKVFRNKTTVVSKYVQNLGFVTRRVLLCI
jgi:hypothetical protein